MRSKPTIAMSSFTPSFTDMYRFTVTADANRKITLNELTLNISGTVANNGKLGNATINVYRDSINSSNLVGTLTNVATPSAAVISLTGIASKEIAAGSTVTFYVEIT
jgi:hypothetical protein